MQDLLARFRAGATAERLDGRGAGTAVPRPGLWTARAGVTVGLPAPGTQDTADAGPPPTGPHEIRSTVQRTPHLPSAIARDHAESHPAHPARDDHP